MAMAVSPRISFSNDIDLSDPPPSSSPYSSHNFDFDFSIETSLDDTTSFSPADHLFSQGKLIPLSLLQPNPITPASTTTTTKEVVQSICYKPKIPVVPRSCSVGAGATPAPPARTTVNPFTRSRSTGSYLTNPSEDVFQRRNSLSRKKNGYYYPGMYNKGRNSTGVRIDPVINVPPPRPLPPFISRGGSGSSTSSSGSGGGKGSRSNLFAYLLCNCRDKNVKNVGFCYSP